MCVHPPPSTETDSICRPSRVSTADVAAGATVFRTADGRSPRSRRARPPSRFPPFALFPLVSRRRVDRRTTAELEFGTKPPVRYVQQKKDGQTTARRPKRRGGGEAAYRPAVCRRLGG